MNDLHCNTQAKADVEQHGEDDDLNKYAEEVNTAIVTKEKEAENAVVEDEDEDEKKVAPVRTISLFILCFCQNIELFLKHCTDGE